MAFDNNQQEPALPGGNSNYKRTTVNHLPKYFRTDFNKKFLQATLDQMIQPGVAEKINGFLGRKTAKAFSPNDTYISDNNPQRENYQLEPVSVITDNLNNVNFYGDYNDYINAIKIAQGVTTDHSLLNAEEFYTWDPHIDWDKFINFNQYYWLPDGPSTITIVGQEKEIQSTYTVSLADNDDNITYVFTPNGFTNNPTLKLFRGQTYRFEVDVPNYPIAFATKRSFSPGEAIIVEAFDGLRGEGIYDVTLYDSDNVVYDAGGYIIPPNEASFTEGEQVNTSLIYDTGVTAYDEDGNEIKTVFIEKGIIEFTVPETAPDYLYYISKIDANTAGFIKIADIFENTEINVENEIIGKKYYTTTGNFSLSNGMKVEFAGDVTPAIYAEGEWYVEGVGDKIKLINQTDLEIRSEFSEDLTVEFDSIGFDSLPFSEALGYPVKKDYIVINRASKDGNLWSRYNRWFHKDVIEQSSIINSEIANLDQNYRAKRPIIEFEAGLKLYDFGVTSKRNVNLIDTNTVDVFSIIEGTEGYNIDGVDLVEGMRIIFTADNDVLVKNRIFTVKFISINNKLQITLLETDDSIPNFLETVLVTQGNRYSGLFFYFDGSNWKKGQEKNSLNQQPLFDLYDANDISYTDNTVYKSSQFKGNYLFSYMKNNAGVVDSELNFALTYRTIENSGDILFQFNLINETFSYNIDNVAYHITTDVSFLRKYDHLGNYSLVNGWQKADKDSTQNVIRQYIADGISTRFQIDVYDSITIEDLWLRVYKNNKRQKINIDFIISYNVNGSMFIEFINKVYENDVIIIKTRSTATKNNNGYYEIPYNLERNPLNENIQTFTVGEVADHLATIFEEIPNYSGTFPGNSNIRDLGNVTKYGRKFLKHSCPLNLAMYHFLVDDSNVFSAITFAMEEYNKFQRLFFETANSLGFEGEVRQHVDKILLEMNKDKNKSMPFYFSDMVAYNSSKITQFIIEDADEEFFPMSELFSLENVSIKSVQIYINSQQLLYGKDYTFTNEGFVQISAQRKVNDIIEIVEYENNNGNYVPPTPTKLGLFPKYFPEIYIDDTVIVGDELDPNTPFKIYGTTTNYGRFNLGWFYPLFSSVEAVKEYDLNNGGLGEFQQINFNYLNTPFYMPLSDTNIATFDNPLYSEYYRGLAMLQGHDGSRIVAYKDFRDKLYLELESRIFNNIKVEYNEKLFNIKDFIPGLHRKNGLDRNEINNFLIPDFLKWNKFVSQEYTNNTYFLRENSFTWNYSKTNYKEDEILPGWWREVYRYAFDTDRPHTHPWEILGFTIKPDWWNNQYGPGPYTSNNLPLWNDIQEGIIRQPTFQLKPKYARPNIFQNLPVDDAGSLLSPNDSNIAMNLIILDVKRPYVFGDSAPIENAWRNSSGFRFALLKLCLATKPAKVFATGFDRVQQIRNRSNQIVYADTGTFLELKNIVFPSMVDDTYQKYTSGIINYISDYLTNSTISKYRNYQANLKSIKNNLGAKLGGFTEKQKFKLILDSRTPLNKGNVFVPEESYNVFLNKSHVQEEVIYSGVIIEKQPEGFYIRGYDKAQSSFNYFEPNAKQNDTKINIGGVTESFLRWDENSQYIKGNIVLYEGSYYRIKVSHTSGNNFDNQKFEFLPALPTIGGRDVFFRRQFSTNVTKLPYYSFLKTIQDVVDFLRGYGKYLESIGFTFDRYDSERYELLDWDTMAKEFVFWTTQNWDANSVISLSPGAYKINFNSKNFTVPDNVFDTFYGYSVLRADGVPINAAYLKFFKDNDNNYTIETANTTDGIYAVRIPLISIEHVVLLDNTTVFNDVIYDLPAGYRQERIKVLGYRIDGWNGSLNIPGFLYDEVKITNWEEWKDYSIGTVVKHKEFYYVAKNKISGSSEFIDNDWSKLDSKPKSKLLANFDYKINQFADFYDLDSDNFDTEQQKLAQHLIGFQKRQYLSNIITDDVSQYKFYQGFIQEKGTKNALTKLFDTLSNTDKDSLEFYEEWAIKSGQYGGISTYDNFSYQLDEKSFKLSPQPIILTDKITGQETDLIYRIPEYKTYSKSENYNHAPFPTKNIIDTFVPTTGYVNSDDVQYTIETYDEFLNLNINELQFLDRIWLAEAKNKWAVYQYQKVKPKIINLLTLPDRPALFIIEVENNLHQINAGDIIGVYEITENVAVSKDSTVFIENRVSDVKGFFKVISVVLNKITVETNDPAVIAKLEADQFENFTGLLTTFVKIRLDNLNDLNSFTQKNDVFIGNKFWIDDNTQNSWAVIENKSAYTLSDQLYNASNNQASYGSSIAVNDQNTLLAVGAPDDGDGKVYVYSRPTTSVPFGLTNVLAASVYIADPDQKFGTSVAFTGNGKYLLVGAPNASHVKTQQKGVYNQNNDYLINDVVEYNDSFWQANNDIVPSQNNIVFSSFTNYNQLLVNLNLDSEDSDQVPLLLAGNYPFTNNLSDHFLIRVSNEMFEGADINDQIKLQWNLLTNANQTQRVLEPRQPFNGDIENFTKDIVDVPHTVWLKVEAILLFNSVIIAPKAGDILSVDGAIATIVYVYQAGAAYSVYINDINGVLAQNGSAIVNGIDFVGEFEIVAPSNEAYLTNIFGGFLAIKTPNPFFVNLINEDTARGLVVADYIPDSTIYQNYYYNILDLNTQDIDSLNTINSYVQILTYQGLPGAFNNTDIVYSRLYVVRAPKQLTDNTQAGNYVTRYFNNLKKTVAELKVKKVRFNTVPTVVKGETLVQRDTDFTAVVFSDQIELEEGTDPTNPTYIIQVQFVQGTEVPFNTVKRLIGSISGDIDCRPLAYPILNELVEPSSIGLDYNTFNSTSQIYDIWDGFIDYTITEFSAGENPQPFEPIARIRYDENLQVTVDTGQPGQIVRDKTTGANAEVIYYKRTGFSCRIFVKANPGSPKWSKGSFFANSSYIEFLPYPDSISTPWPDYFGRSNIYAVVRTMGVINQVSMGYSDGGIGKLLVFDAGTYLDLVLNENGEQKSEILGEEYWLYTQSEVFGIPRLPNIPSSTNLDWTQLYKVETNDYGYKSDYVNEGLLYIFQKVGEVFFQDSVITAPKRRSNQFFGTNISIGGNKDLYRAAVSTKKELVNDKYDGPLSDGSTTGNEENYIRIKISYNKSNSIITNVEVKALYSNTIILNLETFDEVIDYFALAVDKNQAYYLDAAESYINYIENVLQNKGIWKDGTGYFMYQFKAEPFIEFDELLNFKDKWYSISIFDYDNLFLLKNGTDNSIYYDWEYARNKKFRGIYSEQVSYNKGDIVYISQNNGDLYQSITNTPIGVFDPNLWDLLDNRIDYVGRLPNDTSIIVMDDSGLDSSLRKDELFEFAKDFEFSDDGEILVVTATYYNEPNTVSIYRNIDGFFQYSQLLIAEDKNLDFGKSISINNDGTIIAIGIPNDDSKKADQGLVQIYKQVNGEFIHWQSLNSPQDEIAEFFGNKVNLDSNKLLVHSRDASGNEATTFDTSTTTFDSNFTSFKFELANSGVVYIYELFNDYFVYGQMIDYYNSYAPIYHFGNLIANKNNALYVSLPNAQIDENVKGTILNYSIKGNIYEQIRYKKDPVDLHKAKKILLYNKRTNKTVKYLDYIDPLQNKIAGLAEENISYKLYYDPAVYTNGNENVSVDVNQAWNNNNIGKLWWDLSSTKFSYPYQGDVTFSTNSWAKTFANTTVDVYEWIESVYLPAQWNEYADTTFGISQGISGKTKYGDDVYSTKRIYDSVSQAFTTKYYFWVKDKKIVPNVEGRTASSAVVSSLIQNPSTNGYQFIGLFNENTFALYNCNDLLEKDDIVLLFEFYTIDNQNINVHNQYQLITDGLETSLPHITIENKWVDSLVGYDQFGRQVPDPSLPEKNRYGTLNYPRQGWFINRNEALKQYIERVNSVLSKNLIVDNKDLTGIESKESAPTSIERVYDITVDSVDELTNYGIAKAKQATISLTIKDGKIIYARVVEPGRGYLVEPTYTVSGKGTGLELKFTLNALGSISSVSIVNGGNNYSDSTIVTIRPFTVLVNSDETILGKWSIYERNFATNSWIRIRSQGYNTSLYWNYIDWYADSVNALTNITWVIEDSYQLVGLEDKVGDIIKINNIGSGGWLLLEKIDNQNTSDYTVNYKTIGKEKATIQFSQLLYNTTVSLTSFDTETYDTKFYDALPTTETRIILNEIKNNIFVEELVLEYNKLFFASLRYVMAEQQFVDWMFKTNFIKIKHNAGLLRQDITFNNDNLPSYEEYVKEVKPFKAKIREYVSSYEKLDNTSSLISDFDLPPGYNLDFLSINPYSIKVLNDKLVGDSAIIGYPDKLWLDTLGSSVAKIEVKDGGYGYVSPPQILLYSQSGSGAKAVSKLGVGGKITEIIVTAGGSGYLVAPQLIINGDTEEEGYPAKASVILDKPLARSFNSIIKFDRISSTYFIDKIDEEENYIGTGSKYVFDLPWPISLLKRNVKVVVDSRELLTSEFNYENIKDTTKGYERYLGRVTLTQAPAKFVAIKITYKKDIALLHANDRIKFSYDPVTGQLGKDLAQLIDGIDYGGVEVKSFDFGGLTGWDTGPWYTGFYDTYDITFDDIIIKVDGSSNTVTTPVILQENVYYNVYKEFIDEYNNLVSLRLDDPNWTPDSTGHDNPNAVMQTILGVGEIYTLPLENFGIFVKADDKIIFRKTTSDGSFLPTNIDYDTLLQGGSLNYSNAKGISSEEINVDGDGFVTPSTSKGPEEVVPGHIQDTLDLKIYERPQGGASNITMRHYVGNNETNSFTIGTDVVTENSLFVKINNEILYLNDDYVINYNLNQVNFISTPAEGDQIMIVTLGYSGLEIIDIDKFVADGSTKSFITNSRYISDVNILVTIDGKKIDVIPQQGTDNSLMITLPEAVQSGAVVNYAIFLGQTQGFSIVTIDNIIYDGSTTTFNLSQTPFNQSPNEWNTVVKVNNNILNAGYTETFIVTTSKEYRMRLYQVPLGSLSSYQLRVYLNNFELEYGSDFTFSSSEVIDDTIPEDQQQGSTIILANTVGTPGDILKIYVLGSNDSTLAGGDYRYGYFQDGAFVSTPNLLSIDANLVAGDLITVYQFSNHDSQGIDRQSFDITERIKLTPGSIVNRSLHEFDGSTQAINIPFELLFDREYAIYKNNVRIDDPNFGTENPITNPNAIVQTIKYYNGNTINLGDLGINVVFGDIIVIEELNSEIIQDESSKHWQEIRRIRNGYIRLNSVAEDDQYVWVVKNGKLLSPSVDYYLMPSRLYVKLSENLQENDVVEIIHFANNTLKNKYGWRQFKDILNRNHYKVLDGSKNVLLGKDLNWYDREILVVNGDSLPNPTSSTRRPGVIFIDNERIEYFVKDGNLLKQLRRGTLGTGTREIYFAGTEIYDQSSDKTIPYSDETLTTIFTADGSTKTFQLDFIPSSVNEFEVFVAGKRLRKNELQSFQLNSEIRDLYGGINDKVSQDSPEGDVTLPAEFSIDNESLILLNTPLENQKVIVIRKKGKLWSPQGIALSQGNNEITAFLQSAQVDLPR